jgi:hypothetical protein
MRFIICYTFILLTFVLIGECQTKSTQSSDMLFQKAVSKLKENLSDSIIKINKFPSAKDSSRYITDFIDILNKEINTKAFVDMSQYSDFSFSTKSYDLTIHEILLTKVSKKFNEEIINLKTEAPIQIRIMQFGNRILLFSYSPFKINDKLIQTMKDFENIYEELIKSASVE